MSITPVYRVRARSVMVKLKRILLIAPSERVRTPAFDRAHALASATGALLHIVAFDYI